MIPTILSSFENEAPTTYCDFYILRFSQLQTFLVSESYFEKS